MLFREVRRVRAQFNLRRPLHIWQILTLLLYFHFLITKNKIWQSSAGILRVCVFPYILLTALFFSKSITFDNLFL